MDDGKTVSQVLWEAADLIEEHGHTKHVYYLSPEGIDAGWWRPGYRMCAVGAIGLASGRRKVIPMTDEGKSAVAAVVQAIGVDLQDWNDAPERTSTEVVALLRETADKTETRFT